MHWCALGQAHQLCNMEPGQFSEEHCPSIHSTRLGGWFPFSHLGAPWGGLDHSRDKVSVLETQSTWWGEESRTISQRSVDYLSFYSCVLKGQIISLKKELLYLWVHQLPAAQTFTRVVSIQSLVLQELNSSEIKQVRLLHSLLVCPLVFWQG